MEHSQQDPVWNPVYGYEPGGLEYFRLKLKQDGYLGVEDLAQMIEGNWDTPLGRELATYLVRQLRGEIKQKRGPKSCNDAISDFEDFDTFKLYNRLLRFFTYQAKRRKKALTAQGWIPPKAEETPSEKAIALTRRLVNCRRVARGEEKIDPGTLSNRLSRYRKAISAHF